MYSYEREQLHLRRLLEETDDELAENTNIPPENPDDESDDEEDNVECQNDDSDSEQEISEPEEGDIVVSSRLSYIGKDKVTYWKKHPPKPKSIRTRQENIIKRLPGPTLSTKTLRDITDIWSHFINNDMINKIVYYTNLYIEAIKEKFSRSRDANPTNMGEIKAFIGLLYMAGICKSNRMNTEDIWRTDGYGVEIFHLTMSLQRFRFLSRCIRFDDKGTREDRQKTDKLTAIREIFENFVRNCETGFHMSEMVTIDEMLPAFRGRCGFRMYIPSKPNKYGIKMFALCDAQMFYTSKIEVYVGQQPDGPYKVSNSPSDVVYRLCQQIKNSGRHLTTDNWFTSVPLAKTLLDEYKLTLTGTIRKNKKELPLEFTKPIRRPSCSSMFGFNEKYTLVSYIPKPGKNVLLLSTFHHSDEINPSTGERHKPIIITDYNATKGGVDVVDRLCANYNCARNTKRWPMVIFYTILNIAGINSQVVYAANNPETQKLRRNILRELANGLIRPHLEARARTSCLPTRIKSRLQDICGIVPEFQQENLVPGRCAYCNWKKNRKTRFSCFQCNKFMCLEHTTHVCRTCQEIVLNNV